MSRIRSALLGLVALALSSLPALAQSSPGWTYGYVPTPAQWNAAFASKQNYLGAAPLLTTGGTMTGPLVTAASIAGTAGLNLPPGTAPTSPINGDLWTTTGGIFVRINGATVALTGSTSASFAGTPPIAVSFPAGVVTYACPTCGVTGSPLSQFAATTSAQLAGVISDATGTGALVFAGSPTLTGTLTAGAANFSGAVIVTSASASCFAVGPAGTTNSALNVGCSTGSMAAGLNIVGAVTGGTVAISVTDPASNSNLSANAKGSGTIGIGTVSTGAITLARATTIGGALTYGGVTFANTVTGTGSLVGSISPTITGHMTVEGVTATGATGTGNFVFATAPSVSSLTVTTAFTATGLVTNAALVSPTITINTVSCTLGSSCSISATAASITVGSTLVASGATTRILYDNAGTLGEYTISGSGTIVAMATAPTLTGTVTFSNAITYGGVTLSASVVGTGSMVLSNSPALVTPALGVATGTSLALGGCTIGANALCATGTAAISSTLTSAAHAITSASASALAVGLNGATNPAFLVDASTATSATGLKVKSAAAAGGVALSVITSGTNENFAIDAAGSGTITFGGTSTGAIIHTRATTLSAALTYGGVTFANTVTGTGSLVGSISPTFTGTLNSAAHIITSTAASCLSMGPAGATNSTLNVDCSTASSAAGLNIIGAATGGTVAINVTDPGSNANLAINTKGSGTIGIGTVSTGAITLARATTISAALTYGGVTFANTVTGSGSLVGSIGPTFTGSPALSTATATSVNGLVITATAGTLTIPNNASAALILSGNFSTTLTATATTNAILPAGTSTLTQTVVSGTSALGTSAIGSGTCATVVTTAATGAATTDTIQASFNADPTGTTGYIASTGGMLTIIGYPTANNVNWKVCNNTAGSITPGAVVTLNWKIVR